MAKEVTEVVTNALIKRQDDFEEHTSTRFDALDGQLAALLGLFETQPSSLHHPQHSRQSPQHSQTTPQQPKPNHHPNSQTTLSPQSKQQPRLSLGNNFQRNLSQHSNVIFTCDICGQTFNTDRAEKNHVRNYQQMKPYT